MFDPRWDDDPRDRQDGDRRDREDDTLTLGRGSGSSGPREDQLEPESSNRYAGGLDLDRSRECRDRDQHFDPRDVFMRHVDLPSGRDREHVHDIRDREYTLRGSESRTLATVGAFRVVSARDLHDRRGRPADVRSDDLRHLREEGLIRAERLDGHRDAVIVLTKEGRDLLEHHRRDQPHQQRQDHQHDRPQEFYAGLRKPREVEHDTQIYRAYLREAERLGERGARIERVVLDYELRGEYQRWLHAPDRDHDHANGRPHRQPAEVEEWARDHDLPYFDGRVHFPDLRIEYERPDGQPDHRDIEIVTLHYRGAHGAAAARSGFSRYRGLSARIGGRGGGARGGRRSAGSHLAEELWG